MKLWAKKLHPLRHSHCVDFKGIFIGMHGLILQVQGLPNSRRLIRKHNVYMYNCHITGISTYKLGQTARDSECKCLPCQQFLSPSFTYTLKHIQYIYTNYTLTSRDAISSLHCRKLKLTQALPDLHVLVICYKLLK